MLARCAHPQIGTSARNLPEVDSGPCYSAARMVAGDTHAIFVAKAAESLASAEADFSAGRYNSCANRCYYACFQAAIAALIRVGVRPRGRDPVWEHEYVQAEFGTLIRRRKAYPTAMAGSLSDTRDVREVADYADRPVSASGARKVLRLARDFVDAVIEKENRS